jgi:hypothetical protein
MSNLRQLELADRPFPVLAQLACASATLEVLYVGPVSGAEIASLVLCNRSGAGVTYRVSLAPLGAADTPAQYLAYGTALAANESLVWPLAVVLAEDDELRVWASAADVSVAVLGEVGP